jgi:hypothetical protein
MSHDRAGRPINRFALAFDFTAPVITGQADRFDDGWIRRDLGADLQDRQARQALRRRLP